MSRVRSNRVCFTLNNYTEQDYDEIIRILQEDVRTTFAIVGKEVAQSGTPHLQGFIHIEHEPKKCGLKFWKELLPACRRAHFENAKGTDQDSQKYCSKDGNAKEIGSPKEATGSKWQRVLDATHIGLEEACAVDPELTIKYIHQIKTLVQQNARVEFKMGVELRPWQVKCMELLDAQNDRCILFVVDEEGGKGKSVLAKHILSKGTAWGCQGK